MTDICGSRKTSSGEPCQRPKGWGTDHPGEGPCKHHDPAYKIGEKGIAGKAAARKKSQQMAIAERRRTVWRLYRAGVHSSREIGKQVGVSHRTVQQDLNAVLEEIQEDTRSLAIDAVTLELDRLAVLQRSIWNQAVGGISQAGETVPPDLQAVDRVLKIMERRAKLLGLDAPTRIDFESFVRRFAQEEGLSEEEVEDAVAYAKEMYTRIERGEDLL